MNNTHLQNDSTKRSFKHFDLKRLQQIGTKRGPNIALNDKPGTSVSMDIDTRFTRQINQYLLYLNSKEIPKVSTTPFTF